MDINKFGGSGSGSRILVQASLQDRDRGSGSGSRIEAGSRIEDPNGIEDREDRDRGSRIGFEDRGSGSRIEDRDRVMLSFYFESAKRTNVSYQIKYKLEIHVIV